MVIGDTQLMALLNSIIFTERKELFKIEGISLYPSEIHLLLLIKEDLPVNATRIADKLGVTKGAVSQTITRLEKKGIINKKKDPFNKNELTLSLTPLGSGAYEKLQQFQANISEQINTIFLTFSEGEQEVIQRFLSQMAVFWKASL
ncbi:MAG: MarR family transcriptional regulator [Syntrophomonas sp.]